MSMTIEEAIAIIEDVTWKDFGRHYGKIPVAREMAILALEEVKKYIAIGTVSEFRELKEKATAKKPTYQGTHAKCPSCFSFHVYEDYCSKCGQMIDWSEGKE